MRSSFRFALSLLLLAPTLLGWVKQGTVSGNITDVEVIGWNGAGGLMYAATGGAGVFRTQDGTTWIEANGNGTALLPDYTVKAIASFPGRETWLLAVCSHGVYFTMDKGDTWEDFTGNLAGGTPPEILFPAPLQDIAVGFYNGQYHIFMATLGAGVFYRTGTNSPMPTFTQWVPFNDGDLMGVEHPVVFSIAANGGRVLAGTVNHLYWLDLAAGPPFIPGWWYTVTDTNFPQLAPVPALSFRSAQYALASVGAIPGPGLVYGGVWHTQWTTTPPLFTEVNPTRGMPTDQPFLSLDYFYNSSDGTFRAAGGTTEGLWSIPQPGAAADYARLPFKGGVTGVGVGHPQACDLFFGGPGKGPFMADLCNTAQRPVPRRDQMADIQVTALAASPGAADGSVFAASRIAGIYKNQEDIDPCAVASPGGYFTRMAGDPEQENSPDVICLALSPIYQEGGDIEAGELTLFAGTNGRGVLRTQDGGRSWEFVNAGLPADAKITALAISPRYGQIGYPRTVFAAVYGSGVFVTKNDGLNWVSTGSLQPIGNAYVNALAIHPDYPSTDVPSLYAGCQGDASAGTQYTFFYYYDSLEEWMSPGSTQATITTLAAAKAPTETHLYAGSAVGGVFLSTDHGSTWTSLNNGLHAGAFIGAIVAAPNYLYEPLIMATVRPTGLTGEGGVYFLRYAGPGSDWNPFNQGLPDLRVLSLEFDAAYATTGLVYAGHVNQGVFAAKMSFSGPQCEWAGTEGFFTTPKRVNGVAVDPSDPDLVFAATDDMGVFVSFDGGFTFRPWSAGLRYGSVLGGSSWPVSRAHSIAVVRPPGSALSIALCGTDGHGIYFNEYDPTSAAALVSLWASAPMNPPTAGAVTEIRVTPEKVLLEEDFESGIFPPAGWGVFNGGSGGRGLTWTDQNPAYDDGMAVCGTRGVSSPLYNLVALMDGDCDGSGSVQDDILETPELLASIAGINHLTLEFDFSFYHYTGFTSQGDVDLYRPSLGGWVTLDTYKDAVIPATHVTLDLTPYLEPGLRVRFHYTGAYDGWWMVDHVKVTANQAEDIRASDTANGDYASANYGLNWELVDGIPAGVGLTDLNYMTSTPLPFGRGKTTFIWGCSSGLTVTRRSGACNHLGRAWAYDPMAASWSACASAGLDDCEDYRAILRTSAGDLLLGSKQMGGTGGWTGMWRSGDSCATWAASNEGLPANPQIYALQELDSGDLLAGVVDSVPFPVNDGGVYLSDPASGGRAWVRYSTGFSPGTPGTVDLTLGGTSIYAGMGEDGIYADSTALTYAGPPTAAFEAPEQACAGSTVPFYDYSAGYPTVWAWTFGDTGTSSDRHPSHLYAAAGDRTVTLTATNAYGSDSVTRNIEILPALDVGETLTLSKTATEGQARLDWQDIDGEENYVVWKSADPGAAQEKADTVGAGVTTVTYTFLPGETVLYFRVQPTSSSYLCGDGIIGGSW